MSLINDSLKNAAQARPQDLATTYEPALASVDIGRAPGNLLNIVLTFLTVVVMLLSGVMLWKWFSAGNSELKVNARSFDESANVVSAVQPAVHPVSAAVPLLETKPVTAASVVAGKEVAENVTKTPAPVETPQPLAVTYKLQGIVFVPKNCSAVVNGQTVYVGDKVPGGRVTSITQDTVIITTTAGKTVVLELL